jgi:hypothetical protein
MVFEVLFKLGAAAAPCGLISTIYFYIRRSVRSPAQAPAFVPYFGGAFLLALTVYVVGTAIGIYFGCLSPDSGNLCGIYGALGLGPLLSGLVLCFYGMLWRQRPDPTASGSR